MCWSCRARHPRHQGKGATPADFHGSHSVLTTASFPSLGGGNTRKTGRRWRRDGSSQALTGASVVPKTPSVPQWNWIRAATERCTLGPNATCVFTTKQCDSQSHKSSLHNEEVDGWHHLKQALWAVPAEDSTKRLPNVNKVQTSTQARTTDCSSSGSFLPTRSTAITHVFSSGSNVLKNINLNKNVNSFIHSKISKSKSNLNTFTDLEPVWLAFCFVSYPHYGMTDWHCRDWYLMEDFGY